MKIDIEKVAYDIAKIYCDKHVTCEDSLEEIQTTYIEIYNDVTKSLRSHMESKNH